MEKGSNAGITGSLRGGLSRRNFIRFALVGSAIVMSAGLVGCGGEARSSASSQDAPAAQSSAGASGSQAEATASAKPTGSKALVAVFSWSGHTLQVAEQINAQVASDLFRIEPATPYTADYDQALDVAQDERNRDYRPALASTVANWDEYDTIYLGYPVWWYHVPQVIKSFFDEHDFSGKTVHPFCTSGGSSISSTIPDLTALCPSMTLTEGLTIDGSAVSSNLDRVSNWVASAR